MNTTLRNLMSFLFVLVLSVVLALTLGCLTAGYAHYRLGWEEVRADNVGWQFMYVTFVVTWAVAFLCRGK